MADLSIIIISYNTKEITKKCIETCIASLQTNPQIKAEIIVLDNNSTDGTLEMLEAFQKISKLIHQSADQLSIKIINSHENLGFSRGNNQAVKQATGNVLLFLNSDIEVIGDGIPMLYDYFISKKNQFNFIGGKLLEKDGHTPQASAGPFYTLPVVFAALFLKGDYYGLTRYSPNAIKKVDWVSGACIMCKKEIFNKTSGFDEKIFMYMEEIDLLYRAKKLGLITGFYPNAKLIHFGSASSASRTQPIIQVFKGFLYFYKKHRSDFEYKLLVYMLQLKALISLFIGRIISNRYLILTYEEALKVARSSR